MDFILFYSIAIVLIGMLLGLLIVSLRYQKSQLQLGYMRTQLENELMKEQTHRQQIEQKLYDSEQELRKLYSQLSAAEERIMLMAHFRQECQQLNEELCAQRHNNSSLEVEMRELIVRLEAAHLAAEEKQHLLINSEHRLSSQFENIANRIFENSGRKVAEHNCDSLDKLLLPLREQLDGFRRQVQDSFGQEARERHTLTHEIHNLQQLNAQIAQEAVNLARALKGNNKIQGNWGEVILSHVLEASGLREGYEFETQVNIKQSDGYHVQPDVIIRLPHGKDVIIDAKMSLVAYERYFNSSNNDEQQLALTEHIHSLRSHIKLLGKKDYKTLPGLRSLDYVLMFIPVEPAFIMAIDKHPELIGEALTNSIMLVSPTTLLVALRTINNLWRYEHQSRNAQHIADRAAQLYDKIRLFVDDMNTIGQNLNKVQTSYQLAMNKLSEGRGNIISQSENFRTLGVQIKRPITIASSPPSSFHDPLDQKRTTTSMLSDHTVSP